MVTTDPACFHSRMSEPDDPVVRPTFPLLTERLALRPFAGSDLDALHAMHSREDVTRYLYWGPRTRDEVRAMLERLAMMTGFDEQTDALRLAAILRDSGTLIGDVSLQRVSREHRQGEIGFVFDPARQGRGYATEATRVMLALGFEDLGLHRIVGRCDGRNVASARLMERLGMRREARLRENEFVKGEWTDELIYAMLAGEWRTRR
jgi:RimJ/RimL family protein N-acetyltransferase